MIIKKDKVKELEEKFIEAKAKQLPKVDVEKYEEEFPSTDFDEEEETGDDSDDITPIEPVLPPEPHVDLFDVENIDFNQRQERRRGTRRRGYRRIDDRNLVSRAQEEAESIKKSAFEEGYRKGLEQSEKDIEEFRAKIHEFMGATKEVFEYIAPDILEMSVDIAKRIVKREVDADPQVLLDIIVDVLKTASKNEPKINIRVNPRSVAFIKDTLPNMSYAYGIDAKINIISDPSIDDGGCVFQTNNGIVDASIDTQIEIIKKALEGI